MECLACGLPVILSANTGHLDLIGRPRVWPLSQSPSRSWPGGGESDVEEILERLEHYFTRSDPSKRPTRNPVADLTWAATAAALKSTLEELDG
jgi:glycosyltransferase involved in cell wall biosynthesis